MKNKSNLLYIIFESVEKMKKVNLLILAFLFIAGGLFADGVQPSGSGTEADPYLVENLDNLLWISTNSSSWSSYFEQTADINASATSGWNSGQGWSPIGNGATEFTSSYDGQDHIIDNLYINRSTTTDIGLFGATDNAYIGNVGIVNANITGYIYTGGLIGHCRETTIDNCYSTGVVNGNSGTGGLIGKNIQNSTISSCYSSVVVNGYNSTGGLISTCYDSTVNNCYSTGTVNGTYYTGGLIGYCLSSLVNNCYSTGLVNGDVNHDIGGLIAINFFSNVTNCFWDTQTSGQTASAGGTGKTTAEMKTQSTYTNWDFTTIWEMGQGVTYPFFLSAPPLMNPPGNALDFDGDNDYVDCGNDVSLDMTNSITIEAWINANSWKTEIWRGSIVGKDNTDNTGYNLRCGENGRLSFVNGISNSWPEVQSFQIMSTNEWYHVTGVYDGVSQKIYINGELVGENTVTGTIGTNSLDVYIAASPGYADRHFDGKIDEVRIWNVARIETEIRENMNNALTGNEADLVAYYKFDYSNGTQVKDISLNCNTGTLNNMDDSDWVGSGAMIYSPVAISASSITSYSFIANWEENYTATKYYLDVATDSSFTNYIAGYENLEIDGDSIVSQVVIGLSEETDYYYRVRAYNGNTEQTSSNSNIIPLTTNPPMEPPGNALDFDGTNDFVDCGNDPSLQINGYAGFDITVEAWIKPTVFGDNYWDNSIVDFCGSNTGYVLRCGGNGVLSFCYGSGSMYHNIISPENSLVIGEWNHVVGIHDDTSLKLYINGELVNEIANNYNLCINTTSNFYIGESCAYPGRRFAGQIDEVRVWNTNRSETGIRDNMNDVLVGNEANLIAYYKFDQVLGTILPDRSLNSNVGILNNMDDSDWVGSGAMIYSPTATAASSVTISSFTANWEENYTATKYYLDVVTDSSFTNYVAGYENLEINGGSVISQSVTGLSGGVTYYYRLRAYNSNTGQTSSNSNIISLITIPPMDPPQNVTIEIIGTDVHLSWDAVTGATSYKVYSSDSPESGFAEDTSGTFSGNSWMAPIGYIKKFYYVTAVN